MKKDTERQLNEAYSGTERDYAECKGRMCFNFYLAFDYLEWSNAFRQKGGVK